MIGKHLLGPFVMLIHVFVRKSIEQEDPTQFPNMFALVHFCEGVLNCALKPICQTMKGITLVANCTRDCIHVVIQLNLIKEKKSSRKVEIPSPKIAHDESPNSASAMTLNFIGRHQGPRVTPLATWLDWMEQFSDPLQNRRRSQAHQSDWWRPTLHHQNKLALKHGEGIGNIWELAMFFKLTNWRSNPFSNDALHWKSHEIAIWDSFPYPFQWSSGLGSVWFSIVIRGWGTRWNLISRSAHGFFPAKESTQN